MFPLPCSQKDQKKAHGLDSRRSDRFCAEERRGHMISIIVPVYNVENYLGRALDSVISQTYPDWEMILVNDGSSDSSLEICREYENKDRRILVINKENGGVSSARNAGLQAASGEWICFMDGDDWLEKECFETALKLAEESVDIISWNFWKNKEESQIRSKAIRPSYCEKDYPADLVKDILFAQYSEKKNGCFYGGIKAVWTKMIRAELIRKNRIQFDPSVQIGEDALFCAACFLKAEKAVFTDQYLYHYRENAASATRKCRPDIKEVYLSTLSALSDLTAGFASDPDMKLCYGAFVYACVARSLDKYYFHPDNRMPLKKRLAELSQFICDPVIRNGILEIPDTGYFYPRQRMVISCIRHRSAAGLYLLNVIKHRFGNHVGGCL